MVYDVTTFSDVIYMKMFIEAFDFYTAITRRCTVIVNERKYSKKLMHVLTFVHKTKVSECGSLHDQSFLVLC